MASYSNLKYYCPKCQHVFYRGTLSFGPGAVECKKCGEKIGTNLRNWADISVINKIGIFFKEILSPTFIGMDSALMRWVVNLFLFCFAVLPIGLLFTIPYVAKIMNNPADHLVAVNVLNIIFLLFTLLYPIFLVRRIFRIRKDSLNYYKNNILPRW